MDLETKCLTNSIQQLCYEKAELKNELKGGQKKLGQFQQALLHIQQQNPAKPGTITI